MTRLKKPLMIFLRYYRNLGLRVTLYALLSVLVAFVSPVVRVYLGDVVPWEIDFAAVTPVLTILASSMLAVSTFSLNIMVTAHRTASETTTPRVHRILMEDTTTQSVLSTFIGAFVYAFASIVLFQSGFYAPDAAVIVMGVTILVAVLVVVAMLRWVQYLSDLGSVDDSLDQAEERARAALATVADWPAFGANPITGDTVVPVSVTPIRARLSGYIQLIDVDQLEECRPERGLVYVAHAPGAHVLKGDVLARVTGDVSEAVEAALCKAFTLGDRRTQEQDAAYGLTVLSEIASKALSPGVNDPGTAIEAIVRLKGLLWRYARAGSPAEPTAAHVFVPTQDAEMLMAAAFAAVARDGAGIVEVAEHLQHTLAALAGSENKEIVATAVALSELGCTYSERAGLLDAQVAKLRSIVAPPEQEIA